MRKVPALTNRLGALALAINDGAEQAAAEVVGRGAQAPAALTALREFLQDGTIERLSNVLGLSHSAAVRLVDRLVEDGYVVRHAGDRDGRSVAIRLTERGRQTAEKVRQARRRVIENALEPLNEREQRTMLAAIDRVLGAMTRRRLQSRSRGQAPPNGWLCRLCDFNACGRPAGACPVATAARAPALS